MERTVPVILVRIQEVHGLAAMAAIILPIIPWFPRSSHAVGGLDTATGGQLRPATTLVKRDDHYRHERSRRGYGAEICSEGKADDRRRLPRSSGWRPPVRNGCPIPSTAAVIASLLWQPHGVRCQPCAGTETSMLGAPVADVHALFMATAGEASSRQSNRQDTIAPGGHGMDGRYLSVHGTRFGLSGPIDSSRRLGLLFINFVCPM